MLGIRASSTTELVLEDCEVAAENVLGDVGVGYKIAVETLFEGRIGIGAQMLGLSEGALDYAMKHLVERKQFGKSVAEFQGMEFQYAQMATEIEAAKLMVYNAARPKDAGQPFVKEAAMAKLLASQVAERSASLAVEPMGGVGFTKEYPVEKLFRDSKIGKIYEGTSNMQLATPRSCARPTPAGERSSERSLGTRCHAPRATRSATVPRSPWRVTPDGLLERHGHCSARCRSRTGMC